LGERRGKTLASRGKLKRFHPNNESEKGKGVTGPGDFIEKVGGEKERWVYPWKQSDPCQSWISQGNKKRRERRDLLLIKAMTAEKWPKTMRRVLTVWAREEEEQATGRGH